MRHFAWIFCLLVLGCSNGKKETPHQMTHDEANQKLVKMHTDIWKMMGLSEKAQKELNGFVLNVNKSLQHNLDHEPEKFKNIKPKQDPNWRKQSHGDYLKKHKERFDKLGISEPTQKELFKAMEFVWRALKDPSVPEKDRKVAEKIRDMMKQLPKCCDDSIFERAAPHK